MKKNIKKLLVGALCTGMLLTNSISTLASNGNELVNITKYVGKENNIYAEEVETNEDLEDANIIPALENRRFIKVTGYVDNIQDFDEFVFYPMKNREILFQFDGKHISNSEYSIWIYDETTGEQIISKSTPTTFRSRINLIQGHQYSITIGTSGYVEDIEQNLGTRYHFYVRK